MSCPTYANVTKQRYASGDMSNAANNAKATRILTVIFKYSNGTEPTGETRCLAITKVARW